MAGKPAKTAALNVTAVANHHQCKGPLLASDSSSTDSHKECKAGVLSHLLSKMPEKAKKPPDFRRVASDLLTEAGLRQRQIRKRDGYR
ncbi:hypothetical protein, partial [Variovorax sp. 22077]|uniref:hypothetical protein n=1 Tax=Variovorax sp. 22077 TaxID=3453867 RepID=UPI003F87DC79